MKKKTTRPRYRSTAALRANQAAIDAAVDDYLKNLWPRNPDGTPMVFPEPEIDPATKADWDARMAARQKITDSYGGKPPYGLCY